MTHPHPHPRMLPHTRTPTHHTVPRIFKLLDEEHYASTQKIPPGADQRLMSTHFSHMNLGIDNDFLGDGDRPHSLSRWTATIVDATQTGIFFVQVHCGPDYPAQPPSVKFSSKVNMDGVDARTGAVDGRVILRRAGFRWTPKSCIIDFVAVLRQQLLVALSSKPQPPSDPPFAPWPKR